MSCACGVQCERPCNAEPGSVCEDCQCRRDAEHRAELAKETKRSAALEALVDMERQVRKETENTLFFVRAELLKVQDDLLQGANREVMAEALIERLRGELDEVKHDRDEWSVECTASRLREAILRGDAAPSPAESTPVQSVCAFCEGAGRVPPFHNTPCNLCRGTGLRQPAPPDDIRERLERFREAMEGRMRWHDQQFGALDKRLAALEAKGEPGTHADDICARPKCRSPRHYNIHDPERGGHDFVEPKGAKP